MRVLHLAPHPDDELLGAPATPMALRDEGHEIINLACSLGTEHERRRDELAEACRRAGFTLRLTREPVAMSSSDDMAAAQRSLEQELRLALEQTGGQLVISPSPHDRHHGHEVVARAAREVLARKPGQRWWMWGLWADLPLPSLLLQ